MMVADGTGTSMPTAPIINSIFRTEPGEALPVNFTFSLNPRNTTTPNQTNGGLSSGRPSSAGVERAMDEAEAEAEAEAKRRKVQRACDICRRKKIRCEGPMNANSANKCANCQEYGFRCTYVEAAKRRGPPKGYIETLEQRCGRLENMLQQICPGLDINSTAGPMPHKDDFDLSSYQDTLRLLHIPAYPAMKRFVPSSTFGSPISPVAAAAPSPSIHVLGAQPWNKFEQDPNRPPQSPVGPTAHEAEDASMQAAIAHAMSKLDIKDSPWRFHGKASPHHLIMVFNELLFAKSGKHMFDNVSTFRREEYWYVPEWELVIAHAGQNKVDFSIWPEPGLDQQLIDAYFDTTNAYFPLLNRPIFMKQYESGLWKTSNDFAKVCLMIFANGSRDIDDERVYWPVDDVLSEEGRIRLEQDKDGTRKYSAGWKYLKVLLKSGRNQMQTPNIFDFQTQVLTCAFLIASAIPHLPWIVSGVGIRAAQEIGIHVRSILVHADPAERALYNRAFWCLYHIDRFNCAAIGRSVAIQDTDFDADYPIAVDDEYWDTGDPERDFIQPKDAPLPHITAFIHHLKLDHIVGAALRTIYAINKSPEHGADAAGQRSIVIELDSALNSWSDSVPDELRWDPTRQDQRLFQQSAELHVYYYYCQILVHRSFIPTLRRPETIGLPSLAICTNAARSICNILDAVLRRARQMTSTPGSALSIQFMFPAWVAYIVLLISIYTGKQKASDRERGLRDINKCIAAMKELELTWRQAGKLHDCMKQIVKDIDLSDCSWDSPTHGEKRAHGPGSHFGPYGLRDQSDHTTLSTPSMGSPSAPIKTPPPWFGQWTTSQTDPLPFAALGVDGMDPMDLFGTGIFDPYNEAFGSVPPTFDAPLDGGTDGDSWAQLLSGYMQGSTAAYGQ